MLVPQTGLRTCDPVITNDVLYQLSYCGGPCDAFRNGLKTLAPDIGQRLILQEKRARDGQITRPSGTENRASRRPGLARDGFVRRIRRSRAPRRCRDRRAPGRWESPPVCCWTGFSFGISCARAEQRRRRHRRGFGWRRAARGRRRSTMTGAAGELSCAADGAGSTGMFACSPGVFQRGSARCGEASIACSNGEDSIAALVLSEGNAASGVCH